MKPWRFALAYIAFGVLALALFAIPIWNGWRENVGTLRVFVPADMQALPDLFHREGPDAVAAAVRSRSDPTRREVLVFAGPGNEVIAGTLGRWPAEIPEAPGTYGHVIDVGSGSPVRIVVSQVNLPGGFRLLMGRESAGLMSLADRFWYGMVGAIAVVLGVGGALAWRLAMQASAARRSEERYALAMAAAGDGHTDWNLKTGEHYISPRLLEICGFAPGTTFTDRAEWVRSFPFHPEDRPKWEQAIAAHFAGRESHFKMELRIVVRGEVRWTAFHFLSTRDAAGEPVRWTGAIGDITEHKRAEEALRRSEERYGLAMEATEEGHLDIDLDTDEMFVSERLSRIHGDGRGARFAKRSDYIEDFVRFYADDGETFRAAVAAAEAKGGPDFYEFEFRILRPTGEIRWLRQRGKVTRDAEGRARRRTGAVADITDARLAREALRASEERYALAVAGSDDGVWDIDFIDRRVFISERARALAGMPPGPEIVPMQEWSADLPLHPEDLPRRTEAFEAHISGKTPAYVGEFRLRQADGTYRWRRLRGLCVRGADGKPLRMAGSISDVDMRRRAEEALRHSEQRYALAMEAAQDAHFDWDMVTGEYYVSPRSYQLYGIPEGTRIASHDDFLAVWPVLPEDQASWLQASAALFAGTGDRLGMVLRATVRGEMRWMQFNSACVRDVAGKPVRFCGAVRDVTERMRAVETLRESEARYARAMDASDDGLWEWNAATDELFISMRAREMWGIPDVVEVRTRADLHARNLQFTEDTIRECIAQRSGVEMTYSVVNQSGELRWIRSRGKVFLGGHGEPVLVTGSLTDVTERKLAADALRHSEEELRARQDMLDLAQKAARAVAFEWHVGAGTGENRWSPDLEVMYGLAPGTYDGTFETWKALVMQADWPAVKAAIKRAHETGELAAEYRIVHPDGGVRWLEAKGRMFFDDDGTPARVIGFMLDVTDRHQAEEELRRLERRLRQAQRLEAMGTLAGGIAHDFNNILGAILGYGEMALRDAPKGSRLARDVDSIVVAGERGRALVDRLLAFSRSGVGERVPVHVEKVVREALDLVSAKLPPNVVLRVELHSGRAAMLGDATQVHQVVMNLATNAIQAMPGGGELSVSLGALRLEHAHVPTIGIIEPGEYLVLEVADNGTGIPPDVLERIFDPFFTTKEVGTGTGLGLSLVHGIVVELGGAIDVVSTPGTGSTFKVYLPRTGETADPRQREDSDIPRGDGQRVLVVDDEEPLVRLATRTLAELGYAPIGFTSSSAALDAFRADPQRFDALITDERMPGMSGSALIREVRGIRGSMPVVLMSGYLPATAAKARESGVLDARGRRPKATTGIVADEVLQKPLSTHDLATSLARVLRL